MTDFEFNKEAYKNKFDKVKLSDEEKNILKVKMRKAELSTISKSEKKLDTYYNVWSKAVAVVLSFAIIGSAVYFLTNVGQEKNSFMLTAYAEDKTTEIGESELKIASAEIGSGFQMRIFDNDGVEPYLNMMGEKDFFQDFKITNLSITGDNIESVTFTTIKKFTYFNLYTDTYNNEFTDIQPLTHSQYTTKDFEEYYDGFNGYVCDGFTFKNVYDSDEIILDNRFALLIESDWNDSDIAEWMEILYDCEEKINEYKAELYEKTGGVGFGDIPKEQEEISEIMDEYMSKIAEKTLDGAVMDITVKFTDGSEQTKKLALGYDSTGDVSFLTVKLV